jgi:dTDP-glucose 4,6-dehydratase
MKIKIYLITGGAGFIGSHFVKYILGKHKSKPRLLVLDNLTYASNLKNLGEELNKIEFIKGDICDINLINKIFLNNNIDYVVNFAAESHVDRSIINPDSFVKTNTLGVCSLIKIAKKYWEEKENLYKKDKRFLQISTDEVYGSINKPGYFEEETPINPSSPYSASKASGDLFVKTYIKTYKFPAIIVRCSNNYGPFQFPEKFIPLIIKNILKGKKIPIYGDGKNIRDWVYVKDCCEAIDLVLHKGISGEVYNIGGNNEKENIEVAKKIINITKNLIEKEPKYRSLFKINPLIINYHLIEFVKDRRGHDKRYATNSSKIKNSLGWVPKIKFEDGIIETIKWYLKNQ